MAKRTAKGVVMVKRMGKFGGVVRLTSRIIVMVMGAFNILGYVPILVKLMETG
jgi:hypothetical protein